VKKRGGGVSRAPLYAGAIALALGLFFYFFLMPLLAKKKVFRSRVAELKDELSVEQETHRKLQHERKLLEHNDPAYLEKYARDNFGWAREGEIVYKLERPR
jgi:cell division protein FtsB